MVKATLLASALALCLATPARAASDVQRSAGIGQTSRPSLPREVVEVQTTKRSAGSIILTDAIGGAVVGAAVGGGVALYNRYISDSKSWGNWGRDIAIGAGIGLAAGLLLGTIDAASNADRTFQGPVADRQERGFGAPIGAYGRRF